MQPPLRAPRAAAAACLLLVAASAARAQTPHATFDARTAADLAAICAADPATADGQAALAFCHGFLQGAGQYHAALTQPGSGHAPVFCVPDPPPTRAAAAQGFAAWVRANPQQSGELAVDGLARWARTAYPCAPAAARR